MPVLRWMPPNILPLTPLPVPLTLTVRSQGMRTLRKATAR